MSIEKSKGLQSVLSDASIVIILNNHWKIGKAKNNINIKNSDIAVPKIINFRDFIIAEIRKIIAITGQINIDSANHTSVPHPSAIIKA